MNITLPFSTFSANKTLSLSFAAFIATAIASGCASSQSTAATDGQASAPQAATSTATTKLSATLQALGDSGVSGTLEITATKGGIKITGAISGLKANSEHGFHIHQTGDCSAADGKSAGGHFNPHATHHGAADAKVSHDGDLGNLTADENGVATISVIKQGAQMTGENGVAGRAFIVHAGVDDLSSQPSGAAGPRIACAVISTAK